MALRAGAADMLEVTAGQLILVAGEPSDAPLRQLQATSYVGYALSAMRSIRERLPNVLRAGSNRADAAKVTEDAIRVTQDNDAAVAHGIGRVAVSEKRYRFISESGVKRMSSSTKRQCDRTLGGLRAGRRPAG